MRGFAENSAKLQPLTVKRTIEEPFSLAQVVLGMPTVVRPAETGFHLAGYESFIWTDYNLAISRPRRIPYAVWRLIIYIVDSPSRRCWNP